MKEFGKLAWLAHDDGGGKDTLLFAKRQAGKQAGFSGLGITTEKVTTTTRAD